MVALRLPRAKYLAKARRHMLRMSSPQHLTGVCNTPLQVNENLRRNGRPKDVTPEAGCRRDLAVGERQRNPRTQRPPDIASV